MTCQMLLQVMEQTFFTTSFQYFHKLLTTIYVWILIFLNVCYVHWLCAQSIHTFWQIDMSYVTKSCVMPLDFIRFCSQLTAIHVLSAVSSTKIYELCIWFYNEKGLKFLLKLRYIILIYSSMAGIFIFETLIFRAGRQHCPMSGKNYHKNEFHRMCV